jgi:hypothetical protein
MVADQVLQRNFDENQCNKVYLKIGYDDPRSPMLKAI